jgi:arylsulfatase A-like enzyme
MDVYSTICELAHAPEAPGSQSKSLVPFLESTVDYQHREAVFSENYFGRMIRHKDWKMVYYPGKPYGELYNLVEDPYEQNNVWQSMQDSAVMRQLKDMLLEWAFASEDTLPLPVRPDHQDETPLDYELCHGGTRRMNMQHWYLPDLQDLYADWNFSTDGQLR